MGLKFKKLAAIALAFTLLGCEGETFKSGGANGGKDAVSLTCNTVGNQAPQTVRADFGNSAVVDAQLCPSIDREAQNPMQVVFIIDFSGSMNLADKQINGRCERLAAAQVAINNFLSYLKNPNAVQFSVISFEANAKILAREVSGASANQSIINAQNFCQAIVKEENVASNTNYEAAFRETLNLLSAKPNAQKKIYFLSDGRPGISSSYKPGIEITAAELSRNSIKDAMSFIEQVQALPLSELFALYLDWQKEGETEKGDFDQSPFDLMGTITGNPGNVKVVSDSTQLPVVMREVTPELGKTVAPGDILVEVRAEGQTPRKFGADASTFQFDGQETSPISFKTLPMQLFGMKGQVVRNQVIVSARDSRFAPVVFYIDWDQVNSP